MACDAVKLYCAPMAKRVADRAMQVPTIAVFVLLIAAIHCPFNKTNVIICFVASLFLDPRW